jgi:hypothetical protein
MCYILEHEHGRLHKSFETVDLSNDYLITKGLPISLPHLAQLDVRPLETEDRQKRTPQICPPGLLGIEIF